MRCTELTEPLRPGFHSGGNGGGGHGGDDEDEHLDNRYRSSHLDTTLSSGIELGTAAQENVALVTPVSTPRVLNLEVLLATLCAVSNRENTVVLLSSACAIHDTTCVELED